MKSKNWTYLSILVGGLIIVIFEFNGQTSSPYKIVGIILLIFGLARLSFSIKGTKPEETFIRSENDEEE
ncbi:MAG: hypothetical protein ACWA5P_12330 [bacterium]